ncbi:MAG TPA: hypothetical protein VE760_06390 [Acidimicrobiales bacterium]|nr:hypothetical protein [Acidimicrobiales bacterium]
MDDKLLRAYVWLRNLPSVPVRDESGEGVISAAIAVLIMAALGALMWVGFQQIWGHASSQTDTQITKIGG